MRSFCAVQVNIVPCSGYASDISTLKASSLPDTARLHQPPARTFPANGTFTPEQATLYNAVLTVQKQLIALCTEASGMSLMQIHMKSCNLMRKELERIGFRFPLGAGSVDTLYPHLIGHPVGIGGQFPRTQSQAGHIDDALPRLARVQPC